MRHATFLDFPLNEYLDRLDRIRCFMEESKLDAVLLTSRDNVEYLSGFSTVSWRLPDKRFWLVIPLEEEPILTVDLVHEMNAQETSCIEDVRIWGKDGRSYIEHLVDIFRDLMLCGKNVGMELGHGTMLHMSQNDFASIMDRISSVKFVDASETIAKVKMVKTPLEIERIVKACEITCTCFETGFRSIRVGLTERDIIQTIVRDFLRLGADSAYNSTNHGYLSLQSGRVKQMTPSPTDRRKIQNGDLIQVDGGAVYKGYTADIYLCWLLGSSVLIIESQMS